MLFLFSPKILSGISFVPAIACFFIPEGAYFSVMGERYVYGRSSYSLILVLASWLFFYSGIKVAGNKSRFGGGDVRYSGVIFDGLSISLLALNVVFVWKSMDIFLAGYYTDVMYGVGGAANEARRKISELKGSLSISYLLILNYVVLPLFFFSADLIYRRWLFIFWYVSAFLSVLVTQSSGSLISFLFVTFMVYVWRFDLKLSIKSISVSAVVCFLFLNYFFFIQSARDSFESSASSAYLMEYFAGSYNRYASIVEGEIEVPGSYKGGYLIQPIKEFPVLGSKVLSPIFQGVFGEYPPNGYLARTSLVSQAGLRSYLTAFTAFGQLYVDFWVFFPLIFFLMGFFFQKAWLPFCAGEPFAIVLYPILAWSILEWRGYLEISRSVNGVIYMFAFVLYMLRGKRAKI